MAEDNTCSCTPTQTKCSYCVYLISFLLIFLCLFTSAVSSDECNGVACIHGACVQNDTRCECFDGWAGTSCEHCSGRVRLTTNNGIITDGSGNYSEDNKCMWLLEPENVGQPIHLSAHQFATECGWDHLYIFDGDSVFSPLIGAFSGLVQQKLDLNTTLTEVVARSGKAYLYFYSDAAYNMTGFSIQYRVGGCSQNCSNHGVCHATTCQCDTGWLGDACHVESCPGNCSSNGTCTDNVCHCEASYKGPSCSILEEEESWLTVITQNTPTGRASSASVVIGDYMWVAGGYSFEAKKSDFLVKYHFPNQTWQAVTPTGPEAPPTLYGHSMVEYKGNLYVFGGMSGKHMQSLMWVYNMTSNNWLSYDFNETSAIVGHSAIVLNDTMYIILGHSVVYGYMNYVQEINLAADTYTIVNPPTRGALVKGGYGHSSVYSEDTGEIFIHGGYHSGSTTKYYLTDDLYAYNPTLKHWKVLAESGYPRYLHTAVMLGNLMLVFGGNTHNDTSISLGAKCYSPDFLAYNRECNTWQYLKSTDLPPNASRYGHTAQAYTDSSGKAKMFVYGGFTGVMLSDIMEYSQGSCSLYLSEDDCLSNFPGRECVWTNTLCLNKIEADEQIGMGLVQRYQQASNCTPDKDAEKNCKNFKLCGTCLSSVYKCKWCSNNCSSTCPLSTTGTISDADMCLQLDAVHCLNINNCEACHAQSAPTCSWSNSNCRLLVTDHSGATKRTVCEQACYKHASCDTCTENSCMWCGSQQRCVETNSYVASFLYGQCQEWTTYRDKCPATTCSSLQSCDECNSHPGCGWCNHESNTGLGQCLPGSSVGPVVEGDNDTFVVNSTVCPNDRWHFIDCPKCQCNGHSHCLDDSDKCINCQQYTTGDHCESCMNGYYGNSKNGKECQACSCNGQADTCNNVDGTCFCRTRGVKAAKCDQCDTSNKYHGNPNNGGTCFYDLKTDYQFTFNLSKTEDKFYTGINFMNSPKASDRDVDFTVNCSGDALLNITYKSNSDPREIPRVQEFRCMYFRSKFEHKDFNFGPEHNLTFYVYVYNFTTPFLLQISFSQFPKIDLVHFFVTFFSCFLSLLIIAAVLYKVKHKFDSYRRRQRMTMELEEMASRPFASAVIEIDKKFDGCVAEKKDNSTDLRKRKRTSSKPGQVALEPLHNQKAAVITLFVQLPTGTEEWTPPGHSGMVIGSALVTLGHQRKQSLEHIKPEKGKHKKHPFSNTQEICV